MAIGGVPTLMDINWAQVNQHRREKNAADFTNDFFAQLKGDGASIVPRLSWDGKNLNFMTASHEIMSNADLWSKYVRGAESRSVKPDVTFFENQIKPYYAAMTTKNFNNQLELLKAQGIPAKKMQKLYQENPEFRAMLEHSFSTSNSQEFKASLVDYMKHKSPGLISDPITGALAAAAGGYGLYKGTQWANPKLQEFAKQGGFKGGLAKMARALPLAAAYMGTEPLAEALGASEEQAKNISSGVIGGIGGFYGLKASRNIARNRLATGLASGTVKELKNRASKLGIKGTSKLTKTVLQKGIGEQVTKQGVRATSKKVGQSAIQKALLKFGTKAAAKQVAGSALPVWGNIAMAAMTIPDLVSLARTMYSGEE